VVYWYQTVKQREEPTLPITRSPERVSFLGDVIVTATEGGTGYWAYASDYHWEDEDPSKNTVTLTAMDDPATERVVTIETIAHGLAKLRKGEGQVNSRIRAEILEADRANDAGDIDADGADVIVQIALFGELVYG
jgi:hypothetical protein